MVILFLIAFGVKSCLATTDLSNQRVGITVSDI